MGNYPGGIWAEDHFEFSKSATGDGGGFVTNWNSGGESFDDLTGSATQVQPENIALLSVYPNPFNARTVTSLKLQVSSYVNLTVYDIAGREVAKLVDGYRSAGSHQVVFDGTDLSSGVYFVKLTAGGIAQTMKLLLVK